MRRLTGKQERFVFHYLDTLHQTRAAQLAGYKGNSRALAVRGSENVRKRNIWAAIKEGLAERGGMSEDEIVARLTLMGRGRLETRVSDTIQGPMHHYDAIKALELLGKNLRLWVDKVEHEGEICLILDMPLPAEATEGPEKKSVFGSSRTSKQSQTK